MKLVKTVLIILLSTLTLTVPSMGIFAGERLTDLIKIESAILVDDIRTRSALADLLYQAQQMNPDAIKLMIHVYTQPRFNRERLSEALRWSNTLANLDPLYAGGVRAYIAFQQTGIVDPQSYDDMVLGLSVDSPYSHYVMSHLSALGTGTVQQSYTAALDHYQKALAGGLGDTQHQIKLQRLALSPTLFGAPLQNMQRQQFLTLSKAKGLEFLPMEAAHLEYTRFPKATKDGLSAMVASFAPGGQLAQLRYYFIASENHIDLARQLKKQYGPANSKGSDRRFRGHGFIATLTVEQSFSPIPNKPAKRHINPLQNSPIANTNVSSYTLSYTFEEPSTRLNQSIQSEASEDAIAFTL